MKFIDKILESKRIETLIKKIHQQYEELQNKIIQKYHLKDELKQGKIFMIILIILCCVPLSIIGYLFISSLLGINLIFSIFKNSILLVRSIYIYIKWLYTIIKNKGKVIKKYVKTSLSKTDLEKKDLELEQELTKENVEEDQNLELIIELMSKIDKIYSLDLQKDIVEVLKKIVLELNASNDSEEILIKLNKKIDEYLGSLEKLNSRYTNYEEMEKSYDEIEDFHK